MDNLKTKTTDEQTSKSVFCYVPAPVASQRKMISIPGPGITILESEA